jgi:GDP-L-fucose synthase
VKIWLTGSSGSLGSCIKRELDQSCADFKLLHPKRGELELLNAQSVKNYVELNKPTHVFHLAATVFGLAGHLEKPDESYIKNKKIDENILDALLLYPPKWIFYAGTVASYGYPFAELPLIEENLMVGQPHKSELGYALAKREALKLLEKLKQKHETKYTYGLITNLYGKDDRFLDGKGHVVVSLLTKAKIASQQKKQLEVWGSGKATRDFLHTEDAAKIICELIDQDTGIVNIATGQEISIEFIAQVLSKTFELDLGYRFTGALEGLSNRVCSIDKLNRYSKFVSTINAQSKLVEYLKSNVN